MASHQERGGISHHDSLWIGPDRPGSVSRLTALSRLESRQVSRMETTTHTRTGLREMLRSDHLATNVI
ncbi:hypothetical protein Taro_055098 [Colocasia esculenta]|uniref:Uncharacterized protein n=1 Tax=Colocasia esculenta TaxID=4460 RepID=A0A843XT82_COLES|nr:hypothetical protein [Colocasia esculenta]